MKKKLTLSRLKQLQDEILDILQNYKVTHGLRRALRFLTKEVILCQNHLEGLREWESKKDSYDVSRIQIGGGKHTLEGYLNIDIVPPADLICDVREGVPLGNNCCDFIFNEHFFEHIDYPISAKKVIREFYRILKPGGQVVLGVPDSELAAKSYIKKDREFYNKALSTWYTNRNCLEHFNTYIDILNYHFRDQAHYWAYDFEKLKSLFLDAGFSKIGRWEFDPSIATPKRRWGSIYVVAIK